MSCIFQWFPCCRKDHPPEPVVHPGPSPHQATVGFHAVPIHAPASSLAKPASNPPTAPHRATVIFQTMPRNIPSKTLNDGSMASNHVPEPSNDASSQPPSSDGRTYPTSITYPTSSVFSRCYGDDQLQKLPPPKLEQERSARKAPAAMVVQVTKPEEPPASPQPSPTFHFPEASPTSLKVQTAVQDSLGSKSPRNKTAFLFPPGSLVPGPVPIGDAPSDSWDPHSPHSAASVLGDILIEVSPSPQNGDPSPSSHSPDLSKKGHETPDPAEADPLIEKSESERVDCNFS